MTLEEAIKILETGVNFVDRNTLTNVSKAEKLGIEALKRIKHQSPNRTLPCTELLPGETEK